VDKWAWKPAPGPIKPGTCRWHLHPDNRHRPLAPAAVSWGFGGTARGLPRATAW